MTESGTKVHSMALLLGGSKAWPKHKTLIRFGRVACQLTEGRCADLLNEVADGMKKAMIELEQYLERQPAFEAVGHAMLNQWAEGMQRSLAT